MAAATTIVLLPVPMTEATSTPTTTTIMTTLGAPLLASTTPAPTAIMTGGSAGAALGWYEARWTEAVTWLLFGYCALSVILLYGLCQGGCLDNRLSVSGNKDDQCGRQTGADQGDNDNLDFSVQARRARRRARQRRRELEAQRSRELLHHWADMTPYEHDLRETRVLHLQPGQQHNVSTTSVVTELGHGDEVELAEIQRASAANGIQVSERHLREQPRAYNRSGLPIQSRPTTVWPSPTQDDTTTGIGTIRHFHSSQSGSTADDISNEYAAELERHRQYRQSRARAIELQQTMTPQQRRRVQQHAQIEANLRAIGLL
ncbi:hypothetical protein Slin15195_G095260 [Septoria linicola]|uniref:Uncharacterized protein n=1 Tax=Septoria linicola TaxID=215465 RepID=A0A9Q9EN40_9PEZI|nr:hypothetical protein Slin15195_G095260 [Septoria linicola]